MAEFEGVVCAVLPAFRGDLVGGADQQSGVEMLFSSFDHDGDGKVSMRELYSGLGLLAAGSPPSPQTPCCLMLSVVVVCRECGEEAGDVL